MELPQNCCKCLEKLIETNKNVFVVPDFAIFTIDKINLKDIHFPLEIVKAYCPNCYVSVYLETKKKCELCGASIVGEHTSIHNGTFEVFDGRFLNEYVCYDCSNFLEKTNQITKRKILKYQDEDDFDTPRKTTMMYCEMCSKKENGRAKFVQEMGKWCFVDGGKTVFLNPKNESIPRPLYENLFFTVKNIDKGYICGDCFEKTDHEPLEHVVCDFCKGKFEDSFGSNFFDLKTKFSQGDECCSWVDDTFVKCGYGSKFDMNTYIWKDRKRPQIYSNVNLMCDNCIRDAMKADILILFRSY